MTKNAGTQLVKLELTCEPFINGFMFQIAIGPRLVNWLQQSSMKNIGIPIMNNMMTNGMRKAPVNNRQCLTNPLD